MQYLESQMWKLEIYHGGNIYMIKVGTCYKSTPYPFLQLICQLTTMSTNDPTIGDLGR